MIACTSLLYCYFWANWQEHLESLDRETIRTPYLSLSSAHVWYNYDNFTRQTVMQTEGGILACVKLVKSQWDVFFFCFFCFDSSWIYTLWNEGRLKSFILRKNWMSHNDWFIFSGWKKRNEELLSLLCYSSYPSANDLKIRMIPSQS